MSLISWMLGKDVVSVSKYDYLYSKYTDLKAEFKNYRDRAEMRERNKDRLIKELKHQNEVQNDMWTIALPYIISGTPMKANDKVRISDLAKDAGLINPVK